VSLHGAPDRFAAGLVEVGDGCWAWMQPNGTWGESNAGLVTGEGETLLVDTLFDTVLTGRMLEAAGAAGLPPVRTLVNTHSDGDHWFGNRLVPADAAVIATEAAGASMATSSPAELARFKRLAAGLARMPGGVGAFGRYVRSMLGPFDFAAIGEVRRPDRTFSDRLALEVGGRGVELVQVGPAHTPGDAIVHVPDARVVYAADVLFIGSTPVMWAGPWTRWVAALDTLVELDAERYVPGHGPVCGAAEIAELRRYWNWLGPAAEGMHATGRSPAEAIEELVRTPDFASFRAWDAPERIVVNVATIYRNLDNQPPSQSPVATIKLFSQVAALGRRLS
jgi:glyoxylase-like metal-dependent hydrolase (beta-lactamase superfamily II)